MSMTRVANSCALNLASFCRPWVTKLKSVRGRSESQASKFVSLGVDVPGSASMNTQDWQEGKAPPSSPSPACYGSELPATLQKTLQDWACRRWNSNWHHFTFRRLSTQPASVSRRSTSSYTSMASSSNRWLLSCAKEKICKWQTSGEDTTKKGERRMVAPGKRLTDCSFFFAALASSDKSKLLRKTITLVSAHWSPPGPQCTVRSTQYLHVSYPYKDSRERSAQTWCFGILSRNFTGSTNMSVERRTTFHCILWFQGILLSYLSASCGTMKCWPFLWSEMGRNEHKKQRNVSSKCLLKYK